LEGQKVRGKTNPRCEIAKNLGKVGRIIYNLEILHPKDGLSRLHHKNISKRSSSARLVQMGNISPLEGGGDWVKKQKGIGFRKTTSQEKQDSQASNKYILACNEEGREQGQLGCKSVKHWTQ